jgi:hypothetical protein
MNAPKDAGSPERLLIKQGRLGPLVAGCELQVRPFTVFIGPQGTGKSLAAQLLYFFRDLDHLIPYIEAGRAPQQNRASGKLIKYALDSLRSGDGYFSPFLAKDTEIEWTPQQSDETTPLPPESFAVRKSAKGRDTHTSWLVPNRALKTRIERIRQAKTLGWTRAIFVPTERLLCSELTTPAALQLFKGPSTFTFFGQALEDAKRTVDQWPGGEPDTELGRKIRLLWRTELGGEIVLRRGSWKWRVVQQDSELLLNIDMASSGQKANWPLVLLAEVLVSWLSEGKVAQGTTIYVEEPEIHLHPAAQCVVIQILSMLVRHGFRVVLTTHSLTVLYTINNLVQAGRLPGRTMPRDLPSPLMRLAPNDVEAYLFRRDGSVRSLVNRDNGFIDEAELGQVSGDLQDQLNKISSLLPD